jgi:hypothetical protein
MGLVPVPDWTAVKGPLLREAPRAVTDRTVLWGFLWSENTTTQPSNGPVTAEVL